MSMSLTLSQPSKHEFGGRPYDFSPRIALAKSRVSPKPRFDTPVSSLRASTHVDDKMTTPHRGLPLPSAMQLADTGRPPPPFNHSLGGSMPAPPSQWHGQEDSMRHWLSARAEEEKRKQEEQKTRQEELRLEQRKLEYSMLRESLSSGVPPAMVPIMYYGIAGSSLANMNPEILQQYQAQLQAAEQQVQHQPSPEMRRGQRLLSQGGPQAYSMEHQQQQQPQVLPSQPAGEPQPPHPSQGPPLQTTFSAYQSGPPNRPLPTSAPRSATHTQLPRLTTNEMHISQPAQQQGPGSAHPLHQTQTIQQQETSSPNISFHYWQPPNESKPNQPQTPASKGDPVSAHPGSSHLSESDYKESPRKRKAQGPHQPAPPPSHTSPSLTNISSGSGRRGGHVRTRSNTSTREPDSRPDSRRDADLARPSLSQNTSQQLSSDSGRLRESSSRPEETSTSRPYPDTQHEFKAERPQT